MDLRDLCCYNAKDNKRLYLYGGFLMKTLIFIADTDVLEDRELFERKLICISSERQAAIEKLRFEKDKRLSLGAGLLLNLALLRAGIDGREAVIVSGEHGKPYLKDYPGVFFNLSHSGSRAMCVISDREAGCDVERVTGKHLRVAEHCFTEEERRYIIEKPGGEDERFFRLWTLKESYIKATGAGLSRPLNSFTVRISDGGTPLITEDEECSLFEPRPDEGYRYACCVRERLCAEPEIIIADLSCP